jgi:hypothetical protein
VYVIHKKKRGSKKKWVVVIKFYLSVLKYEYDIYTFSLEFQCNEFVDE